MVRSLVRRLVLHVGFWNKNPLYGSWLARAASHVAVNVIGSARLGPMMRFRLLWFRQQATSEGLGTRFAKEGHGRKT